MPNVRLKAQAVPDFFAKYDYLVRAVADKVPVVAK